MKKQPRFSVTIPAYKRKYLKECIKSILLQTYTDFEVIIVNDASPEDLDSIVNEFNDKRIRYYTNEKGCGAVDVVDNWNICLGYVTGNYLICMGDDDKLLPNCLEEYNKLIVKYPGLGLYHGWTEIIDEESKVTRMQEARPLFESVYSAIWHRWNGRIQFIGDYLFDTKILRNNGGFYKLPLAWGSDDLSAFIAATHGGVANTQIPVFQYRVNTLNISNTGNSNIKMDAVLLYEKAISILLLKESDSDDIVFNTYKQMCNNELYHTIVKKKVHEIRMSIIREGFARCFFWFNKKQKYGLSFTLICWSLLDALKTILFSKKKNQYKENL